MGTLLTAGLLADIGEIIPVVAIIATFSIPIIAILTTHQRKMAEILHRGRDQQEAERAALEVQNLREVVTQQTFLIEDLRQRQDVLERRAAADADLRDRLKA
jgi:hypothetical protein